MLDVEDAGGSSPQREALGGHAVVRLPDRSTLPARCEIVVGRTRYSVGGHPTEGPRWWRGRLYWAHHGPELPAGAEVLIDLDNGWTGIAVVEPTPAGDACTTVVRGVGPAPPARP